MTREAISAIVVSLLFAMAIGSALILSFGQSPGHVYLLMLARTWGDLYGVGQVIAKATPLVATGLAVALALRAGLLNIGAEGQLTVGAFASGVAAAALPASWPAALAVPLALLSGALAGGAAGALPGWLKARFGAHEVLSTIMLNFIVGAAVLGVGRRWCFVEQTVHTPPIPETARLPFLGLEGSAANASALIAAAAAPLVAWLLSRTPLGFEMRALGRNPQAAEAAGVLAGRTIVVAMALAGALAGLGGAGLVVGYKGYFEEGLGAGAGFLGVAVAFLSRAQPLAVVPVALLFATLEHGGLAASTLVPKETSLVLEAVLLLCAAVTSAELRRVTADGSRSLS